MLNWFLLLCVASVVAVKKPNFVVILTDDQDVVLAGMDPMVRVRKIIGNGGMTFTNAYTTSPICCPSRASILSGQYVHNHLTFNNSLSGGCYGTEWRSYEEGTFTNALFKAGYNTFYAGKYLNQYGHKQAGGPERVPPGWSEWHGLVGNSVYYNYTISNNGVPTYSSDLYLTDVIKDLSVGFLENQVGSTKPFLIFLSPPAPHQPFTPAGRHRGAFANVTALRHPNFNVAVEDKHWLMSMPPSPLPEDMLPDLDSAYRLRWESLLAVDEMVGEVVNVIEKQELMENTYFIYTSDNGYHIGQFAQFLDKRQPYETDIKVPLLIRGPGIESNTVNQQAVLNIDLAPTILRLAGVEGYSHMDGHVINFNNMELKQRSMLIEYHGEGGNVNSKCPWMYDEKNLAECLPEYKCKCQDSKNNTYACIRHLEEDVNMKYCLFNDEVLFTEMYNLEADQYEMYNLIDQTLPAIKHWYDLKLAQMLSCKGAEECDNPLEQISQNEILMD